MCKQTCKVHLQCHKMLTGAIKTTKSDSQSKNAAPACVLVQSNKYPEAAQDYGSSCAPETNDAVLQRRLQVHAKDAGYHGSNACGKACH